MPFWRNKAKGSIKEENETAEVDDSAHDPEMVELIGEDKPGPTFTPDAIDVGWKAVQIYGARAVKSWSDRFPHREFYAALTLCDHWSQYGYKLPPHGKKVHRPSLAGVGISYAMFPARVGRWLQLHGAMDDGRVFRSC